MKIAGNYSNLLRLAAVLSLPVNHCLKAGASLSLILSCCRLMHRLHLHPVHLVLLQQPTVEVAEAAVLTWTLPLTEQ
jgi:hypothetical protein